MKFISPILISFLTLFYYFHLISHENIQNEAEPINLKLQFIEEFEQKYQNHELYLADSSMTLEMKQSIEQWCGIQPYISGIRQQNEGFKFLGDDLVLKDTIMTKKLCVDKGICVSRSKQNSAKDSVIFISQPQIYFLDEKPTGYVIFKKNESTVIQANKKDRNPFNDRFYIWTAVFDEKVWTSQIKVQLF